MDVKQILTDLNIQFREAGHRHVSSNWIGIDCPTCSPNEGKFKLGINLTGLYASCWSCGGKRLSESLSEASGKPLPQIWNLLNLVDREFKKDQEKPPGKLTIPKGVGPLLEPHKRYLKGRGFVPEEIEKLWKVKGIGVSHDLAWRIWIPIFNKCELISWTARSIEPTAKDRYLRPTIENEAYPASRALYGADFTRYAAVIVEGPVDAWRIGPGAVATMGVGYSKHQFRLMSLYPTRVVCFDNDSGGQQRAAKLVSALEPFPGQTYNVCLDAPDPGSANLREIKLLREKFLE